MHNTNTTEEKRRFHRALYDAPAILTYAGNTKACKIVDLSLKGCLLAFSEIWTISPATLHTLSFQLSEETSIVMDVSPVHTVGNQIGFLCKHIDLDSITNLRRLVELNLGNSELLERELAALSNIN
jgi:hypothetical protein